MSRNALSYKPGFSQPAAALFVAFGAIVVIAGGVFATYRASSSEPALTAARYALGVAEVRGAVLTGPIVGTVQLADGSFSTYRLIRANLTTGEYQDEVSLCIPMAMMGSEVSAIRLHIFMRAMAKISRRRCSTVHFWYSNWRMGVRSRPVSWMGWKLGMCRDVLTMIIAAIIRSVCASG